MLFIIIISLFHMPSYDGVHFAILCYLSFCLNDAPVYIDAIITFILLPLRCVSRGDKMRRRAAAPAFDIYAVADAPAPISTPARERLPPLICAYDARCRLLPRGCFARMRPRRDFAPRGKRRRRL